ncbi:VWA domain-containing protein [Deinococcus sp.]|uniref:VWA domain-containing protein n=1 Tax=Deinococcus sp. TaxID=47478 RepID=UPI0025C17F78|nr:VWA domain-containing protein [Deinococcus sp.]
MTALQVGQRVPLADLNLDPAALDVQVHCDLAATDVTAFGLQDGRLADDRYMVFYNQPASPGGALRLTGQGERTDFTLDLTALPGSVTEVVLAATHDSQPVAQAHTLSVTVGGAGTGSASFDVKPQLRAEKAVMLVRFYRHGGAWRLATVAQGFDGGLDALVRHFGGEVAAPATPAPTMPAPVPPAPATPRPAPPVNLRKERQRVLLEKAQTTQPHLVNLIKTANVSLEKRGLSEALYRVNLVLDISGSMSREYRSGAVQDLAERALALAARLDDDGQVDVYLFGIKAQRAGSLSLDNSRGFVDRLNVRLEAGTHYSPVMQLVREDAQAAGHRLPTLVLFITDGGSSNRAAVIRQMTDSSREPIFWKFMGIDQGGVNFDFLEKLDDLRGRVVDNADFFSVPAPITTPDADLFELLVNELDTWQAAARAARLLP